MLYLKNILQLLLAVKLRSQYHLHVDVQHNQAHHYQVRVQDVKGCDGKRRVIDERWLTHDYRSYEEALRAGVAHATSLLK